MNKVFEKIRERLIFDSYNEPMDDMNPFPPCRVVELDSAIKIVNQVEEEYVHHNDCENCLSTEYIQDKLREMYEDGYTKALDDAIEKFLEYGCFMIQWSPRLSKEKLVTDVLHQAKGQVVYTLEKMKEKYGTDKNVGSNDGWIPVSSGKMPENGRRCWVTYEWANGSLHVDKDYLVNGKWFETEDEAVKAWMYNDEETPEPYQPKGEK